jgi:UDP-N-acetylglucosamine 2-epimerase (non-hydrolysing)
LREVFAALRELADVRHDIELLYPVHPNPNVRGPAEELLAGHPRIRLTQPLDYLDLLYALRRADLAITDSGGIQEEAPSFGTPVLVLREVTERPEAVESGAARLVGMDRRTIVEAAVAALDGTGARVTANPYGDGNAGGRIADIVVHTLTGAARRTEDWRP